MGEKDRPFVQQPAIEMTFTTPIYLLLLLPWAGVLVWVLMGRADFVRVSTTQFWDRTETTSKTRRGIRKPPLAMVLLLLAALAGILAAGGMAVADPLARKQFVLVLDRDPETITRYRKDTSTVWKWLNAYDSGLAWVDLVTVPDGNVHETELSDLWPRLMETRATGEATGEALERAIMKELARHAYPVVVVTSRHIHPTDDRVRVLAPGTPIVNAGIEKLEVVETPSPQAMVRVWNGTAKAQATLRVGAAEQVIELPATGSSKDYFVDLPAASEWVSAELVIEDDIAADNRAYVAKRGAWPRVEARVAVPAGVGRLIEVYRRSRPTTPGAPIVAITHDLATPGPAIVLAPGSVEAEGAIRAEDHPVTRDVDWTALADLIRASTNRIAPAGKALVWVGISPVVVALPDRRLWIGFDLASIAQRPEFVVFLTDAIDFVGGGKPVYASEPARTLDRSWKRVDTGPSDEMDAAPGVYRTQDRLLAMNISVAKPELSELSPPEAGTTRMVRALHQPISGVLLVVSLGLVMGAMLRLTRS